MISAERMRQAIALILTMCLLAIPIANSKSRQSASGKSKSVVLTSIDHVTVSKIIDGDTFVLSDGRHVRLLGIDTPEKGEPFAETAKSLADSIFRGRPVRLELDKKNQFDKYGRLLAYAFVDGLFYNKLILRRGLGGLYLFRGNQPYKDQFILAQNEARKAKRGIWSLPVPSGEPYYIAAGGSYRFHRPLCRAIKNINLKKARRYRSRDGALDAGLSPCRDCKP